MHPFRSSRLATGVHWRGAVGAASCHGDEGPFPPSTCPEFLINRHFFSLLSAAPDNSLLLRSDPKTCAVRGNIKYLLLILISYSPCYPSHFILVVRFMFFFVASWKFDDRFLFQSNGNGVIWVD